MAKWNQDDLFVVATVSQVVHETPGAIFWDWTISFENLAVEPVYFEQAIDVLYAGDKNVLNVDGCRVTIRRNQQLDYRRETQELSEEAWMLLRKLSKHPKWGKEGGPNMRAEHELLD